MVRNEGQNGIPSKSSFLYICMMCMDIMLLNRWQLVSITSKKIASKFYPEITREVSSEVAVRNIFVYEEDFVHSVIILSPTINAVP